MNPVEVVQFLRAHQRQTGVAVTFVGHDGTRIPTESYRQVFPFLWEFHVSWPHDRFGAWVGRTGYRWTLARAERAAHAAFEQEDWR